MAASDNNQNLIVKTTSLVMKIVDSYLTKGDFAVDCTMGKGYDTLSLAKAVGCINAEPETQTNSAEPETRINFPETDMQTNYGETLKPGAQSETSPAHGRILAFDIQENAIMETTALLAQNGVKDLSEAGIELIKDSHEHLEKYLSREPSKPSAIIFNLGFMPGYDKSILTTKETTIPAVKSAIDLVKENGIVSITTYSGHSEGLQEHEEILKFLSALPAKKYHIAFINMINQKKTAPAVFFVTRKAKKKQEVK